MSFRNSHLRVDRPYFHLTFGPDNDSFLRSGYLRVGDARYVRLADGSLWKPFDLFDSGWGDREGLMRATELSFDDLLNIFFSTWCSSRLSVRQKDSNRYGSALLLVEKHFNETICYFRSALGNAESFPKAVYEQGAAFLFSNEYVQVKVQEKTQIQKKAWQETADMILTDML